MLMIMIELLLFFQCEEVRTAVWWRKTVCWSTDRQIYKATYYSPSPSV